MAVAASMLASYAAFSLAERLERTRGFWRRRLWVTAAATVLGLGMWSMHFFGALENLAPNESIYSLQLVILCLLLAISIAWLGFRLIAWQAASRGKLVLGSAILALGLGAMNVLGFVALRTTTVIGYNPAWLAGAALIGIPFTWLALWMAFGEHSDPTAGEWMRVGAGAVMGTGMAVIYIMVTHAVVLEPAAAALVRGSARGNVVGETAFLITIGLMLLVTLGTAAIDKRRYQELARLNEKLAYSQQALMRSESQLREANALLSELSIRDGLTGLYNRRRFDEVFEMEWRRSLRNLRPLALLMIDVDCFKSLNDAYGHQRGDDCLREVARVLEEQPRRGHDIVARFGGEEFAVLLPGADVAGAMRIGENIRRAVEGQQMEHKRSIVGPWVTVSVGVSSRTPQIGETPETMLYDADMAMYSAKQLGRNRVEIRDGVEVEV
ncbi:MAG: diguanylate cyclase [Rhodospirillales bacterium]|nr:diguanylate cyclase [Acetobacter sp.]